MSLWAVGMVKDEGDVIYDTVTHLASEGVSGIIVADNLSTDDTAAELERAKQDIGDCRLLVVSDDEVGYYQSAKITALAHEAAMMGASWIIPFDADEVWYHPTHRLDVIAEYADHAGQRVIWADMWNHYVTDDDHRGRPFEAMVYRHPEMNPLPKVMFRWHDRAEVHMGNHDVTLPGHVMRSPERVAIRHFSNRSAQQFLRKSRNGAAAYAAAVDLPGFYGTHWREYGEMSDYELRAHFHAHFTHDSAEMILDPAPVRRWTSGS